MSNSFTFNKTANPNSGDKVYRNQRTKLRHLSPMAGDRIKELTHKAVDYYQTLQADSGHWPGDYGGPLFLTPGLIIASYVTGSNLPASALSRFAGEQYFLNHQNVDGGWGLHIEGPSSMFGTVMQYVALRLLGLDSQHQAAIKAKAWIGSHGGATGVPSWGEILFSCFGCV